MRSNGTEMRRAVWLAFGAGGLVFALGLMVVLGWCTKSQLLIEVFVSYPVMHHNTALCLMVCGASAVALAWGWRRAGLAGGLVAVFGALVLLERLGGFDLGLDHLSLQRPDLASYASRVSPGTALCALLTGVGFLLLVPARLSYRVPMLSLLGCFVAALAAVVLVGYEFLGEGIVRGSFTSMAVSTAAGFGLSACALLALAWRESLANGAGMARHLYVPVGIALLAATLILWQALNAHERVHIHRITAAIASQVQEEITAKMRSRALGLSMLTQRWRQKENRPGNPEEFAAEVESRHLHGLQAVERVSTQPNVRWQVSREEAPAEQKHDTAGQQERAATLPRLGEQRGFFLSRPIPSQHGDWELLLGIPASYQGKSFGGYQGKSFGGYLGVFRSRELLDSILSGNIAPGYVIALSDGDQEFYRRSGQSAALAGEWAQEGSVSVFGASWRLQVCPEPAFLANQRSPLPTVVLAVGILTALLLTGVIGLAEHARLRTREVEAAHQRLQEEMTERQRAQESLRQAHVELEGRVQERTAELSRVNAELTQEMSERSRAELALRESERLKGAILESALDCIVTMDADGNIVEFNPAAEKTFGHSRSAVIGRNLAEVIIPHAQRERHRQGLAHYLATGQGPVLGKRIELMAIRADDTEFPVELAVAPINLEGRPMFAGFVRDLTERHRAERALQESEQRFRGIFSQVAVGIAEVGLDGHWLMVNQKVCDIVGYTRAELLQQTCRDITHPDDFEAQLQQMQRLLAGEIATFSMEKRYLCKDRSPIWVNLTMTLARDTANDPKYYLGVMEDITARKSLEEQFRQSQKMEAVGRLAGGVAHDFNNLLTVISGYSEIMLGNMRSNDPQRLLVEEVKKAGDRAAGLTRQLLAFSRKQVLEPKVLDVNQLVAGMDKMLRRLIGEDIELSTLGAADLGPVLADPGQLEQVLMNLAVNARDAMPFGGRLTIETANVTLQDGALDPDCEVRTGTYVMLAVTDTGCGMDKKTVTRIFEPFFTTKGPEKGTGLGLAVVYGIVKQSGGYVHVYSEVGHGTTFRIYLPWHQDKVTTDNAPTETSPTQANGSETVLLVEDEEGVRQLSALALRQSGYHVVEATNGVEGLQRAADHAGPIHLLVTDVIMPSMGGRPMADQLSAERPELKVLFLSGYTDNAITRHGVLAPGIAFLQKPFTPKSLARKVREVLDRPRPRGAKVPEAAIS